jgi:hypothetical protein
MTKPAGVRRRAADVEQESRDKAYMTGIRPLGVVAESSASARYRQGSENL